ncbi:glycosyltransferase family 2 protein [Eubacterium ventriosum]|uniref:glycosyltransferase family 2 protein n=1 Tax=Eubacterium ventriosum TaxID=39496 RepID=UPI003AB4FE0A
MKSLQVLVSTMWQTDYSLIEKMNIDSEAIVVNQCDRLGKEIYEYHGKCITWLSFPECGVGKSRNNALIRADSDICLFADDDVVYYDNYKGKVVAEFEKFPDADLIIFNICSTNPNRPEYKIRKLQRVHFYNCLRYGTFRIAIRLDSIRKERLFFSQLFGGGCKYGSGEDSLFLMDCIKRGLRIYASPEEIGTVNHISSTWFSGHTEQFFFDKGALFCSLSKHCPRLLCLQFCLRHKSMMAELKFFRAYQCMLRGIDDYRKRL